MRSRSFATGFLFASAAATAAVVARRRAARRRDRAELFLADGTLVSLSEGQPGADRLLQHARELLATARS
ncbi:MAG TPA: hypothetical protein VI142_05045 [Gaiellaceae bacterium]